MVSIYTKAGLTLILLGFGLVISIGILHLPIPFATGAYGQSSTEESIPTDGNFVDIKLAEDLWQLPFGTQLTVRYSLYCEGGEVDGNVLLLYSSGDLFGQVPGGSDWFYVTDGELNDDWFVTSIRPTGTFDLYLRFSCDASLSTGTLYLQYRELTVQNMFFVAVLPGLMTFAGLAITIGGFIRNYRKLVKGKPAVSVEWEPSLQWRSSSPSEKRTPKMAIKSVEAPKKAKVKTVKKTVPKGGPQQACKFCGKEAPASAFFCPHCYAKIR
jgi:hypothetical protein